MCDDPHLKAQCGSLISSTLHRVPPHELQDRARSGISAAMLPSSTSVASASRNDRTIALTSARHVPTTTVRDSIPVARRVMETMAPLQKLQKNRRERSGVRTGTP
ncbi:hypothetical protein OH77DRAFT_909744 [Trametes cingulata]|nr:hypothetical protein OH77DRAFT_909744 [Trametes cingulata]